MDQEKKKVGRPPKVYTRQEDIEKLKGTARDYAQRNRGQAVDQELETLLPPLREQIKAFPDLENGARMIDDYTMFGYCVDPWLEAGKIIIRNEAYGKTPRDFVDDEEELAEDQSKVFEETAYADCFTDALANEFASRAKKFHLTPELVQFTIRVLQAALDHGSKLPGAAFVGRDEIAAYLDELRNDSGTFREPPKPKGKPGPKPRPPHVPDHAEGKSYVTYSPEAKPDQSGVRDDLPFLRW